MKTKNLFLIILIILCLTVLGCKKMKNGIVMEKWYEPATTHTMLMPIRSGKVTIWVPYTIYDNEDWCIKVRGITDKGDSLKEIFYVSQQAFDTISVGEFVCVDGACDDDNNNTKTRQ